MDRKTIKKTIKRICEEGCQTVNPDRIVLYGSFHREKLQRGAILIWLLLVQKK